LYIRPADGTGQAEPLLARPPDPEDAGPVVVLAFDDAYRLRTTRRETAIGGSIPEKPKISR
jgi:hypothetical protein